MRASAATSRVKATIDLAGLDELRRKYSDPKYSGYARLKFLDIDQYLARNVAHAERLGLLGGPPRRILDLGSGCGYFPYVCRHFGHEVYCIDRPGMEVFDDMMALMGLDRIDMSIRPMVPLDLPWRDLDFVTGLMVKFDAIGENTRYGPDEWHFLISDLSRYLTPVAGLYFEFNKLPLCPEIEAANIAAFKRRGALVRGPGLVDVTISNVSEFLSHR